jgi:hypothetical protein
MTTTFHAYIPDSMSARPEFYSGRGATTSDLNSQHLEDIHANILKLHGPKAAAQFVKMVADIPVLSATDFLIALQNLDRSGWKWTSRKRPTNKGIEVVNNGNAGDYVSNLGTIASVLGGMGRHSDQTESIRYPFIRQHFNELPKAVQKKLKEPRWDRMDVFGCRYYPSHY